MQFCYQGWDHFTSWYRSWPLMWIASSWQSIELCILPRGFYFIGYNVMDVVMFWLVLPIKLILVDYCVLPFSLFYELPWTLAFLNFKLFVVICAEFFYDCFLSLLFCSSLDDCRIVVAAHNCIWLVLGLGAHNFASSFLSDSKFISSNLI